MEAYPPPKYGALVCEQPLGNEAEDQQTRLQAIGQSTVRLARKFTAVSLVTALAISAGPLYGDTEKADSITIQQTSEPPLKPLPDSIRVHHSRQSQTSTTMSATITNSPIKPLVFSERKPRAQKATKRSPTSKAESTWITDFPDGYFEGEAYSDDTLFKLGSSNPRGFDYGLVMVNGVGKCGWVKTGVLHTRKPDHKASICKKTYKKLTFDPYSLLKNINCKPGSCTDGTWKTPLTDECDHNFYQNFATASRSVLNVNHRRKSGFSSYVGQQYGPIHYRATIRQSSTAGEAIVVRSNTLGWGLMSAKCAPPTVKANDKQPQTASK